MSRLDDLIKSLCPDGVKFRKIKEVCTDINTGLNPRKFFKVNTIDAENYYVTIREMVDGNIIFSDKTDKINDEAMMLCNNRSKLDENTVLFSGTGTIGRIVVLNEAPKNWNIKEGVYALHPIITLIVPKYLGYVLQSSKIVSKYMNYVCGGTVKSIPMRDLKNVEIPVPPLEIQKEIVRLLDDFTAKTAELQTELNKEYEARKKQYECYRDNLIRNELHISKVINLIDIADVYDSLHQTPSYSINGYNMVRVQDIKGGYINIDKTLKVEETVWKLFTQKYVPQPNDVVVSRVGSYGNFALIPNNQCCLGQNVALIHPKINPQYLYYVLTSTMTKQWINNNVKGTSQKSLSLADIKRVPIPVPNENNQKYIADILNNFNITMDELQLNISIELESRQKQYEYYRDKLLTFKELNESEVN